MIRKKTNVVSQLNGSSFASTSTATLHGVLDTRKDVLFREDLGGKRVKERTNIKIKSKKSKKKEKKKKIKEKK